MSQAKILNNIVKYLTLTNREANKELALHVIEAEGVCFSLSLIRAVMRKVLKKGNYWDHLLVAANNWDGTVASLNNQVQLPETNDGRPVKLRDIFERLIHFVLPNQGNEKILPKEFHLGHKSQIHFLLPDKKQFEVSVKNPVTHQYEVKYIAKQNHVRGTFTPAQLVKILDKNTLQSNIVIFGNRDHAIEGGYENGEYVVYDPNYKHKSTESMVRKFKSKKKFFAEIQRILGPAINIEIAALNPNASVDLPNYRQVVLANSVTVLKHGGWREIYTTQPKLFPEVIAKAILTKQGIEAILAEIALDDVNALSLLDLIIRHVPGCLGYIIEGAKQSKEQMTMLARAFVAADALGDTAFHTLADSRQRNLVRPLIDAACEYPEARHAIAATCDQKDESRNTGFFSVLSNCKNTFGVYLHAILFSPNAVNRLLNAFKAEDSIEEVTGLVYAARAEPEYLPKMFDAILKSKEGLGKLTDILIKQCKQGYTAADVIDELDSKNDKQKIIDVFKQNLQRYDVKALQAFAKQLEVIVPENKRGSYQANLRLFAIVGDEPTMWATLLVEVKNEIALRLQKTVKKPDEEQRVNSFKLHK